MSSPALLPTKAELAAARPALPAPVVLVPTMGALHSGHLALLRAARAVAGPGGSVIVSIFVNPLQFRPGEDLDRYPRTLDDDLAMCAREGVCLVFAPSAAEMYPGGAPQVTVDPGPAGQVFEGEFRPGFFGGVLTVVLKLFHLVRPDIAVFGERTRNSSRSSAGWSTTPTWAWPSSRCPPCATPTGWPPRAGIGTCPRPTASSPLPCPAPCVPARPGPAPKMAPKMVAAPQQRWPPPGRSWTPSPPWPSTTSRWSIRARSR